MTTIAATSPAIQYPATVQAAASAPPPATAPSAAPPAVVVSIGKGTLSASVHPADATAEQRVASVVGDLKSV